MVPPPLYRRFLFAVGFSLLSVSAAVAGDGWSAFGHRPNGEEQRAFSGSPQWDGGEFVNPQKVYSKILGSFTTFLHASVDVEPKLALPVETGDGSRFRVPPATGLRVTWFGHSSMLLEIDGQRVLLDPVWGERVSPFTWAGPKRWFAPPVALEHLPPLDVVVLSHDHYDHLDLPTILALQATGARFVVPLGVGSHLRHWGLPADRVTELDWWEETAVGALRLTCTPARHASGRLNPQSNQTLWAGWAFRGPDHAVWYSGDTGLFPAMRDIGERLGPFDLTLIESGAYNQAWPDWHLGPEQTVRAHQMVRGELLIPVHWGLFNLATHAWTEPAERVTAAAAAAGVEVRIPRPGQSVEPEALLPFERWWPDVPWRRAEEDPIVSSQMDAAPPG